MSFRDKTICMQLRTISSFLISSVRYPKSTKAQISKANSRLHSPKTPDRLSHSNKYCDIRNWKDLDWRDIALKILNIFSHHVFMSNSGSFARSVLSDDINDRIQSDTFLNDSLVLRNGLGPSTINQKQIVHVPFEKSTISINSGLNDSII
jgi:hypothetical protein